jgi:hypothetical protein
MNNKLINKNVARFRANNKAVAEIRGNFPQYC